MKKNIKTLFALGALLFAGAAFTSCSNDDEHAAAQPASYKLTVGATKAADTRALTSEGVATWATGEQVYVMKGTEWLTGSLTPDKEGAQANLKGELSGQTISAGDQLTLQFPRQEVSYEGQDGTLATVAEKYDYATATATVESVEGDVVTAKGVVFENQQAIVRLTLQDEAGNSISASSLKFNDITVNLATAGSEVYVAVPAVSGISIEATVGSDTYTYENTVASVVNGKLYNITIKMQKAAPAHEWVDLGLSVKWAKTNIGAETETDYGYYFAWGETAGYDGDGTLMIGENDIKTNRKFREEEYNYSLPFADAATTHWGSDWRMPTEAEIQELLDNTDNEKTTIGGVVGRKFTSKTDNTKYIFLPHAGERIKGSLYNAGVLGSCWSSSLYESNESMACLLNSGGFGNNASKLYVSRYAGKSVRPVRAQ